MTKYEPHLDHRACDHATMEGLADADEQSAETAACELESALTELETIGFTPANLDEVHEQLRQLRRAWNYLNASQLID